MALDDYRRTLPWWRAENLATNQMLVDVVRTIADEHRSTPSQVALAWVLAKGRNVVPIPGTKRSRYLRENLGALTVDLNALELGQLDTLRPALARTHSAGETNRLTTFR